jgi:hypothetical protein
MRSEFANFRKKTAISKIWLINLEDTCQMSLRARRKRPHRLNNPLLS